jgi:UDP-N-acetylmuramoyl-tripeptide--D-alanyl-D-alanine ligase
MTYTASLLIYTTIAVFAWRRLLQYLRFFQQEGYDHKRFYRWLCQQRLFDTRFTLILGTLWLVTSVAPSHSIQIGLLIVASASLAFVSLTKELDPRTTGKLRLVMTLRAKKLAVATHLLFIAVSSWIFYATTAGATASLSGFGTLAMVGLIQLLPVLLMMSNFMLRPFEARLQASFKSDALQRLNACAPYTVGITGSYGKTGAKAALGELLTQCLGPTFWPPQGINTVMGITRSIRQSLNQHHRYAVIEMGAYTIGSIKRLCDFTPPKAALVTSVGIMHLERFGSAENVYRAKSELAQSVPSDGILVCNGDSPNARRMTGEHPKQTTLLYGLQPELGHLDVYASEISFTAAGTTFNLHYKDLVLKAVTPLLGRPALLNVLGAYTMACALGAEPHYAAACLANLKPVDNRLVYDKQPTVSYLRDAYNSNPIGFSAALEVLQAIPASRRILMTPGMIELGEAQYQENKCAAVTAASVADLVIVVGKTNRESFLDGLQESGYPKDQTIMVDSRDEAFDYIRENGKTGDLVLLENDLGDLHEGRVRF